MYCHSILVPKSQNQPQISGPLFVIHRSTSQECPKGITMVSDDRKTTIVGCSDKSVSSNCRACRLFCRIETVGCRF
ncbi:hypothetical protein HanIR_Chr17g0875201 [Helianthus annuus]|nr:hypothetical protein HanIR_Chr17g0875201 [Helianthus annuus]